LRTQLVRNAGVERLRTVVVDEVPALWPDLPAVTATDVPQPELAQLTTLQTRLDQFETIADFGAAYTGGKLTPLDVAKRALANTQASDELSPPMRLFIAQDRSDVLSMAQASTDRYQQGAALGPLDGVPIAIKDEVDQAPYPTTAGRKLPASPAAADSTVVERLRAAGALLIGKTNMTEIGIGVTGINVHHGTPRNPHDPMRITGGSSSGPAAIVASGLAPVALGADGGGSIRTPAAMCGVVGLKPTFGRVSEHGAAPLCWSVVHLGPIATSVRDAATMYAVIAGPDPKDENTLAQPAPRWDGIDRGVEGLRIGVYRPWFEHADPQVVQACTEAVERLRSAGAQLVDVTVDDLGLVHLAHLVTIGSEMTASQRRYFDDHLRDYSTDVRLLFALLNTLRGVDYVTAQQVRRRTCDQMRQLYSRIDVLATPATATTATLVPTDALKTGESNLPLLDRIMRYATLANLTGYPAISFPAGYDDNGMPINLQLMGRAWEEHVLLRAAFTAEQDFARRIPKVHYRLLSD
jgi:Asp-tRNA(Asn)/Glu-tRNA(Gln) amidotransferase A subunit family amidase